MMMNLFILIFKKNLANRAPLMVNTVSEQSQFYYLSRLYITYKELHFF